jgi:hypothetical protein
MLFLHELYIYIYIYNYFIIYQKFILANTFLKKIKQFKWCDINVWPTMHVDTIVLELEYFNYDNVKPFKINFPYNRFKICFFKCM